MYFIPIFVLWTILISHEKFEREQMYQVEYITS